MEAKEIENETGVALIQCPYCGTSTDNLLLYGIDSTEAYIKCLHCGSRGPVGSLSSMDTGTNYLSEIVRKYNTRSFLVNECM